MTNAHRAGRGVAMVAVAACIWGTWSIFIRLANAPMFAASCVVFLLMGVMVLPSTRREVMAGTWDRSTCLLLMVNSLCSAGNVVTYFGAIENTTVAIAVLTHYVAPVLVALVAPYIEKESGRQAWLAALVACAGLALVLEPWRGFEAGKNGALGFGLGLASAGFFTGAVLCSRRLAPRIGAARVTAYHGLIAGVLLLPLAIPQLDQLQLPSLGYLALGAAIPGAFASMLFIGGLAMIGSSRAALLTYLEPLVAVIVAWIMFGETVGALAVVGAILVVAAGYAGSAGKSPTAAES